MTQPQIIAERRADMPQTPITAPEHAPSIIRTTLAITGSRDTAAPSWGGRVMYDGFANCAVSADE